MNIPRGGRTDERCSSAGPARGLPPGARQSQGIGHPRVIGRAAKRHGFSGLGGWPRESRTVSDGYPYADSSSWSGLDRWRRVSYEAPYIRSRGGVPYSDVAGDMGAA